MPMSAWLFGSWRSAGFVAASTLLIYASTVVAIRLVGERRTLTQMGIFDFAVAVAIGAIIGRTATTRAPTYAQGLTAVVALLVTHNAIGWIRVHAASTRKIFGRPPIALVVDGRVDTSELRRAHLTRDDLDTALRERGVVSLSDVRLAILESRGEFSVLTGCDGDESLWSRDVLLPRPNAHHNRTSGRRDRTG